MRPTRFDDELFDVATEVVQAGTVIMTLGSQRLNRIISIDREGVLVETERSSARRSGPQRVPAWMIAVAWERLHHTGELSQQELLNELNVKRSAFVCALMARFPGVCIRSTRPIVLELQHDRIT